MWVRVGMKKMEGAESTTTLVVAVTNKRTMNRQVPGAPRPLGGTNSPISQRAASQPAGAPRMPAPPTRPANGQIWGQPAQTVTRPASFAQAVSNSAHAAQQQQAGSASLDINDFPALGSGGSTIFPRGSTQSPGPPGLAEDFPALPGNKTPRSASPATTTAAAAATATGPANDLNKYGMNGLMGVIRMENNDQTTVAIGNDLTTLGLDFNPTNEPLSRTFASPWVETSKYKPEPEFKLPECYDVPSAAPQQQKIQNLTDETLFYIFYTMPRDTMQEAASIELTNRNWRFHKELKLWLTKDPYREPVPQTHQTEKGQYIFFDPSSWSKIKKEYVLYYPDIA